ncbi:MAG: universal stress protein [Verrucomicrobia bacterium]|nr:universal stress protein [Verrucomicrobiota bacterium]MBV8485120.1 universal stress protein [Verrucomicrobiota bacterium]
MHASKLLTPVPNLPIARIRNTQDLFALVPRQISNLLLVVDPAAEPDSALVVALEIAERWGPQITLVHGGMLSGWQLSTEPSAETALADLLCLSWQVKGEYRDISISQTLPHSLAELFDEAVKRKADLILLPEPLTTRFQHPELVTLGSGRIVSPCPIVVVMESESEW